ncbi:hypothetical protein JHK87_027503 [Glycine soja]|nr:hypothetical protein JHK87_027503 [Glycine soja]
MQMGSNYWISWAIEQKGRVNNKQLMGTFALLSFGGTIFILGRIVLRAHVSFFDTTPSSQITSRWYFMIDACEHEWIMARVPPAVNMGQMKEEAEDEAHQEPVYQWGPSESLMIQKMDAMFHHHQEHSADVHSTLENITTRLESIGTRLTLSNLFNPNEDEA